MTDNKRQLREEKRELKRCGNRARRNFLKVQLRVNPTEAHWAEFDFDKNSTKELNGKPRPDHTED